MNLLLRTSLFGLSLRIWPPVNSGFDDLVVALKLVLELVFELAHLAGLLVHVHGVWPDAAFKRASQFLLVCSSLRHIV